MQQVGGEANAHAYRVAIHDGFCGCKSVVMKFSAAKLIRLRYQNYLNANSQPHSHTVTQPCICSSTLRWKSRMTDLLELWGKIDLKGASKNIMNWYLRCRIKYTMQRHVAAPVPSLEFQAQLVRTLPRRPLQHVINLWNHISWVILPTISKCSSNVVLLAILLPFFSNFT